MFQRLWAAAAVLAVVATPLVSQNPPAPPPAPSPLPRPQQQPPKVTVTTGVQSPSGGGGIMLDSTLTKRTVVIDSAGSVNSYGPRGIPMIPYLADSTLFIDAPSSSMLVLDPSGKVSRVTQNGSGRGSSRLGFESPALRRKPGAVVARLLAGI